ncbi:tetratricopeptide repeat-containing sensor histidine kinase [Polaribacter aestuariivivens]|nr:tetratricopeptide repeat protein [Polaribacter aestuariivivens]
MLNLKLNKNILKAKVYYKLGGYYNKKNQSDSAYYYFNKSKESYLFLNDSVQIGRCLSNIAIIESNFGNYILSDSTAVESLKYINGKRSRTTASVYNCLAINSKEQFLYKDAIYYYQKAIDISKRNSSKNIYKNNIANVYKELKNYTKSILILKNLLEDSISDKKTKARIIDNLAHINWLQNVNINVEKDLQFAKSIREEENDIHGLIASYSHLADYFFEKDKIKATFYLGKMLKVSKKEKSTQDQIEALDKLANIQTPQKSIKYYQESIHLRDSLQKENTQRQYKFAKIKYDYEEEEKQKLKFEALATQNQLIAEQEKNQKKNIIFFAILLIAGLVFLGYRRKQQNKKRILQEKYKTETKIAKRLHDELGNGIYNAITKVLNPKFETEEIVQDLDKLYLQTRAISHENDSIETGADFENYFRELVASYNSNACKISFKGLSSLQLSSLSKEKQVVIYRVFNELFVNMKKHSKATLVIISCKKVGNKLEMIYKDNGVGFRENMVVIKNGLKNMEIRINSIQGTLNFDAQANKGFKATIRFKK